MIFFVHVSKLYWFSDGNGIATIRTRKKGQDALKYGEAYQGFRSF